MRDDNQQLLSRMRDYQDVLEVAQASNISLSKRLEERDMAVSDLQTSLDAILKEKYATENQLREQIDGLENQKRDLNAQVVRLWVEILPLESTVDLHVLHIYSQTLCNPQV